MHGEVPRTKPTLHGIQAPAHESVSIAKRHHNSGFRIPNSEFELLRLFEDYRGIRTTGAPCSRQDVLVSGYVHIGSLAANVSLNSVSSLAGKHLRSVCSLH